MADLIKVSIVGTMPSGEAWSVNPIWRLNGAPETVTAAECNTIATAVNAIDIPTAVTNMMSSGTTVTGCRIEARSMDGTLEALAEGTRTSIEYGSGTGAHPFQTSVVFSLRSPLAGARGRGRFYWPGTGAAVAEASLRLAPSTVTSYLAGMKVYLLAIQAAVEATASGDTMLGVWSRTTPAVLGVTRIQLGDVLDTQRRRRDAAVENYSELAFP